MVVRRNELSRAYKQTPRQFGVYRIRNTVNGKSLIGASHELRARLNRHLAELKLGTHFETLDTLAPSNEPDCDPDCDRKVDLEELESLWLDTLQPFGDNGYNEPGKRI